MSEQGPHKLHTFLFQKLDNGKYAQNRSIKCVKWESGHAVFMIFMVNVDSQKLRDLPTFPSESLDTISSYMVKYTPSHHAFNLY